MPLPLVAPSITISSASPPDFASLATILPLANAANPIERFMFRPDHRASSQQWALQQFHTGQKPNAGTTTHILKAVTAGSGEAIAFAIIRVVSGCGGQELEDQDEKESHGIESEEKDDTIDEESSGWEANADEIMNHEFCDKWMTKLKDIYERHMKGKDHAYWSTLMVLPEWQGRGVGSAMIQWALKNLHLDTIPVWLCGQPDGYALYQKFGWRDIENVDINLSDWAGPDRGYGMHRTVCMLREPSGTIAEIED